MSKLDQTWSETVKGPYRGTDGPGPVRLTEFRSVFGHLYSRRTLNYRERIELSNLTQMTSMTDHVAIGVETLRIDSRCSLEKEFTDLIRMNPLIVLYLIVNKVDSCHGCVCCPLT